MAYQKMSADDIIQMFADRAQGRGQINWAGTVSGCAWTQRNGNDGAGFWITRKQANWAIGQFIQENKIERGLDWAEGTIFLGGHEVKWRLQQTSTKRNNGAGLVKLARTV